MPRINRSGRQRFGGLEDAPEEEQGDPSIVRIRQGGLAVPMMRNGTPVPWEPITALRDAIDPAFDFGSTPQGNEFWNRVYMELDNLAAQQRAAIRALETPRPAIPRITVTNARQRPEAARVEDNWAILPPNWGRADMENQEAPAGPPGGVELQQAQFDLRLFDIQRQLLDAQAVQLPPLPTPTPARRR